MAMSAAMRKRVNAEVRHIIQKDPLYNCIVHHAYDPITKKDLIREVKKCKTGAIKKMPKTKVLNDYIEKLEFNAVILETMVPTSDEWHYVLSKTGKIVMDEILGGNDRYNHPHPINHDA